MSAKTLEDFKRESSKAPLLDEEDLGPCVSALSTKWFNGIGIKRKGHDDEIFQYTYLAVRGTGSNTKLTLIFAGHENWKLVIQGRNLLPVLYYVKEHRIEWLREADRDFAEGEQVYIEKIEVHDVTPSD